MLLQLVTVTTYICVISHSPQGTMREKVVLTNNYGQANANTAEQLPNVKRVSSEHWVPEEGGGFWWQLPLCSHLYDPMTHLCACLNMVSSHWKFHATVGEFLVSSSSVIWKLEPFCDYVWSQPPAPQPGPSPGVSWGKSWVGSASGFNRNQQLVGSYNPRGWRAESLVTIWVCAQCSPFSML